MKVYSSKQDTLSYKREVEFEYEGEEFYLAYYWESERGFEPIMLRNDERLVVPEIPEWLDEEFIAELDNEADLYVIERDNN